MPLLLRRIKAFLLPKKWHVYLAYSSAKTQAKYLNVLNDAGVTKSNIIITDDAVIYYHYKDLINSSEE